MLNLGYRGSKLNEIGKSNTNDKNIKTGNIIKWKRAAERYLMKRCFFTILHAGQLTTEPSGNQEIIWDTDDILLRNFKKISIDDTAEVIIQALIWKEAIGRSIDIANKPITNSKSISSSNINTKKGLFIDKNNKNERNNDSKSVNNSNKHTDWLRFWSKPGNCMYPSDFDDLQFK